MTDIEDPQFGKVVPCPDCDVRTVFQLVQNEMARARIPLINQFNTFDSYSARSKSEEHAIEVIRAWCVSDNKWFLFLTGNVGTGKTHLACAAIRDLFERHHARGQFWKTIDLLDRYKATFGKDSDDEGGAHETVASIDRGFRGLPVLVLDDYGTESSTPWANERLFRLIDERYAGKLRTIITSNLPLQLMPDRILSRLTQADTSQIVYFDGTDQRPLMGRSTNGDGER